MKPVYDQPEGKIYQGDALEVLSTLPDESVNCCVTSPPYWGLRDYGTAKWVGGSSSCDHVESEIRTGKGLSEWSEKNARGGGKKAAVIDRIQFKSSCSKCGAARVDQQIGLEQTPDEFVKNMVEIFSEVLRVLRSDGTLWLNLGDSYSDGGKECKQKTNKGSLGFGVMKPADGYRPKNLMGIPWRVAFALQSSGWYLRQDIIWHKPNPMPESVKDRCTKAHEYIFLLSKSQRYFFDHESIKEQRTSGEDSKTFRGGCYVNGEIDNGIVGKRQVTGNKKIQTHGKHSSRPKNSSGRRMVENVKRARLSGASHDNPFGEKRNKRSVWTVSTKPFSGAHFATFPPDLIEPCILAGCPAGGIVLDPFFGSGTTGMVAYKHDRKFIGIDLNESYLKDISIPRISTETQQLKIFPTPTPPKKRGAR